MTTEASILSRRGLLRFAAWAGAGMAGLVPTAISFAAAPDAELDAREGRTNKLTAAEGAKFKPLARGVEAESFAVVLANGERHLFRISGGKTGAAKIEAIGPTGGLKSTSIMEGDSPAPYLESKKAEMTNARAALTCGGFWDCFFPCMVQKVGAGIWNNLRNNWLSCWTQARSRKYWYQKIAKFIECICSLPYGSYAISCFFSCR